jgi:hypothetical protein
MVYGTVVKNYYYTNASCPEGLGEYAMPTREKEKHMSDTLERCGVPCVSSSAPSLLDRKLSLPHFGSNSRLYRIRGPSPAALVPDPCDRGGLVLYSYVLH